MTTVTLPGATLKVLMFDDLGPELQSCYKITTEHINLALLLVMNILTAQ